MRTIIFCLFAVSSLLMACEKPAGEGGTSEITGKVYKIVVDDTGDTLNQYYAADMEVFISYGPDGLISDDRAWSGPSGDYKFSNLTPGDYSIYVYSYCELCVGKEEAIVQTVTIPEDKSDVTMDDIVFKFLVE